MRSRAAVLLAAGLVAVPAAHASIWITNDATRPQLAVDARGFAQVTWTQAGARQTVIVPSKGQLTHGGGLTGPDVSRPAPGLNVPLAVVVRRGPGGMPYALQRWQVRKRLRIYVYLDCFGCRGAPDGLSRMLGVAPKADGMFALLLRPSWIGRSYRATVAGPSYAPDAQTVIVAP